MRAIPSGKTLTKPQFAEVIAAELGISMDEPVRSQGTVLNAFLEQVVAALGGSAGDVPRQHRHRNYDLLEAALGLVGMDIDLRLDTSAEAESGGGGTVTAAGFARLLDGVRRFRAARYFIVNETDSKVSAKYEDQAGKSYGFDDSVSGRVPLLLADGDARLIFYRTSKSSTDPKMFVAHAVVREVVSIEDRRWVALLRDYERFPTPVPRDSVDIAGWNPQVSITEVCRATYDGLLEAGGVGPPTRSARGLAGEEEGALLAGTAPPDVTVYGVFGALESAVEPLPVQPLGSPVGERAATRWRGGTRPSDKAAELKAVEIVTTHMLGAGWVLLRDAQSDGVGYDLEFGRGDERLLIEVKGIQGPDLRFNMTAREWQRAEQHPEFLVAAVTNVLQPSCEIHVLRQPDLFKSRRVVTQYRVDATA